MDEPLLVAALEAAQVPTRVLAWDDPSVDWAAPRLVVIRSTWNYHHHPEAFLAWAESCGARLANPASTVEWNHHKRYLRDLEASGLPVVPTLWLTAGQEYDLPGLLKDRAWSDVVVKPAVSAGSHKTSRLRAPLDLTPLRELVASCDTMVQPYVSSVDTYGERSVICIDGSLTHAIRKSPRLSGQAESVSETLPIADDERALASGVLSLESILGKPLYGRVDIVRNDADRPMLSEVELIEPSLFLRQNPLALGKLVAAIVRRFHGPQDS